ncbi:MAG: S24 family peptidase [Desulfobulbus sp.]|nr:S24 family peptidase [Desulfobulbus sp.]
MIDQNQFEESWERVEKLTGWKKHKELADFLGISGSSVSGTKSRGNFPLEWAYKIAADFGGSTDWIIDGKGPMRPGMDQEQLSRPAYKEVERMDPPQSCTVDAAGRISIPRWQNPDPEMFDYVPLAEAQLSAGGGCFVLSEEMEGYYAFRKNWLSRVASSAKNLVLMRVQGDSMHPTIQDGDTVMIDTGRVSIKEGMLYALRFNSTIMVKRLAFRTGGRIQIISDNRQEYDPFEADVKDLHLIGEIIFFCRSFVPD